VNVITDVPPDTPYTVPLVFTVATLVVLLVHTPPPPSVSKVVVLAQSVAVPEIAEGRAFTTIVLVALHPVLSA